MFTRTVEICAASALDRTIFFLGRLPCAPIPCMIEKEKKMEEKDDEKGGRKDETDVP